jgi:hypothetical protein
MREIGWDMADCPGLALDVKERYAAFGSRIKFKNLGNAKPLLETVPYPGASPLPQAILMRCAVSFAEGAAWSK